MKHKESNKRVSSNRKLLFITLFHDCFSFELLHIFCEQFKTNYRTMRSKKKRAEFIEHALTLHAINREISISRRFVKFHAIELRKENGAYTRSSAVDRIRQLFFAVSLIAAIKLQFILNILNECAGNTYINFKSN